MLYKSIEYGDEKMEIEYKFVRIFYDKSTGDILYQMLLENPEYVTDFAVLEIDAEDIDFSTHIIERVDEEGNPVIAKINTETDEQKRIRELEEDIKLLQADYMIGGLL